MEKIARRESWNAARTEAFKENNSVVLNFAEIEGQPAPDPNAENIQVVVHQPTPPTPTERARSSYFDGQFLFLFSFSFELFVFSFCGSKTLYWVKQWRN
jgi:hypothetical protein